MKNNMFEIVSLKIELSITESMAGTPLNVFPPRICVQSLKPSFRILQDPRTQKEEREIKKNNTLDSIPIVLYCSCWPFYLLLWRWAKGSVSHKSITC